MRAMSDRVARPLRETVRIVSNEREGGASWRLVLQVPGWPGFEPGQFAMLSPGPRLGIDRSDPLLPRPMAVYRDRASNGSSTVEILYKAVGRGTGLLAKALPGQEVSIVAPLGRAFPEPLADERVVIVAGGTGIASVYELAVRESGTHRVDVVLGARAAADLMAVADFEALDVALHLATEDGSVGTHGRVTDVLTPLLARPGPARVYCCGPTAMMARCSELAAGAGAACVVSLENPMACGFGVCLGCAAPMVGGGFALVCRDGPAFDGADVDWERMP